MTFYTHGKQCAEATTLFWGAAMENASNGGGNAACQGPEQGRCRPDPRQPMLCCECLMPVRRNTESHEHCVCMCDPRKEEIALFAD